jgi:hypothetical protein
LRVDWTTDEEGLPVPLPIFSAITARSYHPGIVNVLLMDGSIRSVGDSVSLNVWRALATPAGGEVVPTGF